MRIELRDLTIRFPGMPHPLLEVPERVVESGEALLIRGASGSGKTSLLHTLTGLLRPHAGEVLLDGEPLSRLREGARARLRRHRIGVVFQRLNLLEHLSACENVRLGRPGVRAADAERALARLGLGDAANRPGHELSLGEQQRVAIARVLAAGPQLILADEPTSALDDANAESVMEALFAERDRGATLIVATHDARIVPRFATCWHVAEGGIR